MSANRLPHWFFLVKDDATLASNRTSERVPTSPLSHLSFTLSPHDDDNLTRSSSRLMATMQVSIILDNPVLGKNAGRYDLRSLWSPSKLDDVFLAEMFSHARDRLELGPKNTGFYGLKPAHRCVSSKGGCL